MKYSSPDNRLAGWWQVFWIWRYTGARKGSYFSDFGSGNAVVKNFDCSAAQRCLNKLQVRSLKVWQQSTQCIRSCEFTCSAEKWPVVLVCLVQMLPSKLRGSYNAEYSFSKKKKKMFVISFLSAFNMLTNCSKRNCFGLRTNFHIFLTSC